MAVGEGVAQTSGGRPRDVLTAALTGDLAAVGLASSWWGSRAPRMEDVAMTHAINRWLGGMRFLRVGDASRRGS